MYFEANFGILETSSGFLADISFTRDKAMLVYLEVNLGIFETSSGFFVDISCGLFVDISCGFFVGIAEVVFGSG